MERIRAQSKSIDSANFVIYSRIEELRNKISTLTNSFQDLAAARSTSFPESGGPPSVGFSPKEYKKEYISSLELFQNGEYEKAIDSFSFLVSINPNHDLADNSQYWIGESYYMLKNYRRAIIEFEKVFTFSNTNKADDAQFKLGLSYLLLGDKKKAENEFQRLIDFYPDSEYISKAERYLDSIKG
jgi:tol-pal system protein YbgF